MVEKGDRRQRRQAELQQTIYHAAIDLVREHGFEGVTMQSVADRADVSRATVFNHFATKDGFLVQYHREMTVALLGARSPHGDRPAGHAILDLMRRFSVWAENDRPMARAMIGHMFTSPEIMDQDRTDETDLAAWLGQAIEQGLQAGEFGSHVEHALLAGLLIGALSSTALEWALGGAEDSLWKRLEPRIDYLIKSARAVPE